MWIYIFAAYTQYEKSIRQIKQKYNINENEMPI